jgi:hypothetical protein
VLAFAFALIVNSFVYAVLTTALTFARAIDTHQVHGFSQQDRVHVARLTHLMATAEADYTPSMLTGDPIAPLRDSAALLINAMIRTDGIDMEVSPAIIRHARQISDDTALALAFEKYWRDRKTEMRRSEAASNAKTRPRTPVRGLDAGHKAADREGPQLFVSSGSVIGDRRDSEEGGVIGECTHALP